MSDRDKGTSTPAHTPGTRKGEELVGDEGQESGRQEKGASGADRPAGTRTARDSTSINPEDVDPDRSAQSEDPSGLNLEWSRWLEFAGCGFRVAECCLR